MSEESLTSAESSSRVVSRDGDGDGDGDVSCGGDAMVGSSTLPYLLMAAGCRACAVSAGLTEALETQATAASCTMMEAWPGSTRCISSTSTCTQRQLLLVVIPQD